MKNQLVIGFLRGLAYVLIVAGLDYILKFFGLGDMVSGGGAGLLTAFIAAVDHKSQITP